MSDAGPGILNSAIGCGRRCRSRSYVHPDRAAPARRPLVLGASCAGLAFALAGQTRAAVVALLLVAVSGAGKLFYDVASRTFSQRLLPTTSSSRCSASRRRS